MSDGHDELMQLEHILSAGTARAWRTIAPVVPSDAYLAGGTAIAVHLRHRFSRDLDFFTENPFDPDGLATELAKVGTFAPTTLAAGTLNGVFESTKVQFLDASAQTPVERPMPFGGIRVAGLADLLATKLKVVQDRGALRDYLDIMRIEENTELRVEEGLTLLVRRYRPKAPAGVIAGVVRGLGYLDDVEDDPSLPIPRAEIEAYWKKRQPQILRSL